jgi:hypothetical protein
MRHDCAFVSNSPRKYLIIGRTEAARNDGSDCIKSLSRKPRHDGRRDIFVEQYPHSADLADHIASQRTSGVAEDGEHLIITDLVLSLQRRQACAGAELLENELHGDARSSDARLSAQHILRRFNAGDQDHAVTPAGAFPAASINFVA